MLVRNGSTDTLVQQQSTILVVAPNQDILNLVKAVLATESNRIMSADNAKEGFGLALEEQPDLILATCGLEEVGADLCIQVRQDPRTAEIPFVVLTTSSKQKTFAKYFANGCDQIVPVPFKCEDLYFAIMNACKRNQKGIESKIHVLFRSGQADFVDPDSLNQLLTHEEVICFRRNGGLAMVGRDPVRRMVRSDYSGPERRSDKRQAC
jgi:CheY-like chemotaxis protein